jgi:tRNA modification GTPase
MQPVDTIFALSSGAGKAGVAVIRVSGSRAGTVIGRLAGPLPAPRRATLRKFIASDKSVIDEGLLLWFPGPGSATGEDMAEFHVHGSPAVIDAVLRALSELPGVRLAEAGEFTRRAMANGRMDLIEVEGLADLLSARTEGQRKLAMAHYLGEASSAYEGWRASLIAILGRIEAAVDFADEADVVEPALKGARDQAVTLVSEMTLALNAYGRAKALREGVRVVLAGPPNAGKSTLLNLLARREAAIVSPIPGTTRDVIEVAMDLGGVPVILMDTAGLRAKAGEEIEAIGMERARKEAEKADVLVWVTAPDTEGDSAPVVPCSIRLRNKIDLESSSSSRPRNDDVRISARSGVGVSEFIDRLTALVAERYANLEHASVIRARHQQGLSRTVELLREFLADDSAHLELAAERLREAATVLGRMTGRIDVEDLLDHVFREFCIGK